MSKGNVTEISFIEARRMNDAINVLLMTSKSMKGKIVYALNKNLHKLKPILKSSIKAEEEVLKKYVKTNKKGDYVFQDLTEEELKTAPQGVTGKYIYKDEKNGPANAQKEMMESLNRKKEIEFHKFNIDEFNNIEISTAQNPDIHMIIEYLVTEENILSKV